MANKNIQMKPIGSGNYADTLHPETNTEQVIDLATGKNVKELIVDGVADIYNLTDGSFLKNYEGNLNDLKEAGFYSISHTGGVDRNTPDSNTLWIVEVFPMVHASNTIMQVAHFAGSGTSTKYAKRYCMYGTWTAWTFGVNKKQEDWIPVTFQAAYKQASSSFPHLSYYKDEFGVVHIYGAVTKSVDGIASLVAYLPVGYRPSKNIAFVAVQYGSATFYQGDVTSDGRILVNSVNAINTTFFMNFSYRTDI